MRVLIITILLLSFTIMGGIAWLHHTPQGKQFTAVGLNKTLPPSPINNTISKKLSLKAKEARSFIAKSEFNGTLCFLIDMSVPSNKPRFFVYDLKKDTIIRLGLVTHCRCNQDWLEGRQYSNQVGGGCTSLGKYRVGYSYSGRFGLAFKLYGLDKTNSNAFKRFVVLHSHECVPENEAVNEICQSDGCPTVSPGFLLELKPMIKNSEKPVLLWIYE